MRVAHASDLHLWSSEGVELRRFLSKRITGGANLLLRRGRHYKVELFRLLLADWRAQLPGAPADDAHFVITGDLSNLSLESELALARRLLDEEGPGARHVSVIPGNHDVYTRGAQRSRRFDHALAPYMTSDLETAPAGQAYPYVRLRGSLAVIGLSSAIATAPIFASGRVADAQLAALEEALRRPELDGRFRLVLVHHPPARPYAAHPLRGLRRAEGLRAVLARAGCELVLHGHEHVPLEHWIPGPPDGAGGAHIRVVGGASSTHDDGRPEHAGRYNVYHLAEAAEPDRRPRLVRIETRVYDAAAAAFVPGPDLPIESAGPGQAASAA